MSGISSFLVNALALGVARVKPDSTGKMVFVGPNGRNPKGIPYILARASGSLAAPVATLTGVTAGSFVLPLGNPVIPANALELGSRICLSAHFRRRGAFATAGVNVRLGTNGTTTDNPLAGFNMNAGNLIDLRIESFANVTSATSFTRMSWTPINGSGGGGSASDVATAFNIATDMFISFDLSAANAGDAFDLVSYQFSIIP